MSNSHNSRDESIENAEQENQSDASNSIEMSVEEVLSANNASEANDSAESLQDHSLNSIISESVSTLQGFEESVFDRVLNNGYEDIRVNLKISRDLIGNFKITFLRSFVTEQIVLNMALIKDEQEENNAPLLLEIKSPVILAGSEILVRPNGEVFGFSVPNDRAAIRDLVNYITTTHPALTLEYMKLTQDPVLFSTTIPYEIIYFDAWLGYVKAYAYSTFDYLAGFFDLVSLIESGEVFCESAGRISVHGAEFMSNFSNFDNSSSDLEVMGDSEL
jgi:hypothetical protein